jgi:hypothetical protein
MEAAGDVNRRDMAQQRFILPERICAVAFSEIAIQVD